MKELDKISIRPNSSVKDALDVLHSYGVRIVLVTDKSNFLMGTVTDGDIRRALIKRFALDSVVSDIMNSSPTVAKTTDSKEYILSLMRNFSLLHIPIVDKDMKLINVETLEHITEKKLYDNPVFLLAGGFGKRLHPLTKETPKPLLKVGNKPILETIILQFIKHGFYNFYISTYYKSDLIKSYFGSGEKYCVNIEYIDEEYPLGTAGSLGKLPNDMPDLPIIIMNGDLLTNVNYKDLLDFHNGSKLEATMCVREYDIKVPYGVVDIDNYNVREIKEKPVHKFFVNAGIYVLNQSLIERVDGKTYLDMTDLLDSEIKKRGVSAFPIYEYWLDIGRIDEYEKANRDMENISLHC